MTNKVKFELEKEVCSSQTVEFSTRFNQEQINGWLNFTEQNTDLLFNEYGSGRWSDGDPLITVQSPEVEDGQGDDHCPYDDEIQEWINSSSLILTSHRSKRHLSIVK